jgi:predicted flap endonuclease-1-like 5' DNA nuclease
MSNQTADGFNPFTAMFEMQRNAIEAGREMLEQSRSARRAATEVALTGLRVQEATQRQALELSRIGTRNYLTALGTAMPGDAREVEQVRRQVDEEFDDIERVHDLAFDGFETNLLEYRRLSEQYTEALREGATATLETQRRLERDTERSTREAVRTAERLTAEAVEATERTGEAVTDATQSTLDAAEDTTEVAVNAAGETAETVTGTTEETLDAAEEATEATLETAETSADAAEDATEAAVDATEDIAEEVAEATEAAAEDAADAADEADETDTPSQRTLDERVHGIGDARAERLRDAGIESLADLAEAEVDAVAGAAEVETELAREWIDRAGATHAQDVTIVDGIGEAHAEELHEGGIESVADLAAADATYVAETADVSEDHAGEWVDDARRRQEEGIETLDGIGESRAERLREANIETLADLAAADATAVAEVTDVSEDRAREWIDAVQA